MKGIVAGMRKYYFGAALFYLVSLISFITYQYVTHRTELIDAIDRKLIECATVGDQFLSPSLHTNDMNADSVSAEQDRQNRLALSRFAENMGVKYVYSFIQQGDKIYFTSSSATSAELKNDENISYYFDEYTETSPFLIKAFETRRMQFEESTDQWGHFRSVYIPHTSPDGRLYITGADIEISHIDAQLHTLLMHSVGKTLFYIFILIPFFIAYRIQNKTIQQELTRQVNERTADLHERSVAVTRLLDNANQGFLTFSTPLVIENEYSRKCLEIFGEPIENKPIGELLYPEDLCKRDFFIQTVRAVMGEEDEIKVEAILSLLQSEFTIAHQSIHITYKRIEPERFMIILTDVTDKKNLEKNIERERNRLKMIVSAISASDEFFELLEEYQTFLSNRSTFIKPEDSPHQNLTELYRLIHTYKGLFAQKDFITTPVGLHKVESRLSQWLQDSDVSNRTIQAMLDKIDFEGWLAKDTDVLRETLGDEFMDKKSVITIDDETFEMLHGKITELIESQPEACHELLALREVVCKLKYKPIGEYFASLPRYVELLAGRLEKSLNPMEIRDETGLNAGNEFKTFAKSLIHVIRNSIDHGIESPEERVANNKEESGTIYLSVIDANDSIEIVVSDDGRGIDVETIRQKAIESGRKTFEELKEASAVTELLFEDYFSTKEDVSDLSGRGIGLGAVRSELLKLGGSYRVVSEKGNGCRFIFSIPKVSITKGVS